MRFYLGQSLRLSNQEGMNVKHVKWLICDYQNCCIYIIVAPGLSLVF